MRQPDLNALVGRSAMSKPTSTLLTPLRSLWRLVRALCADNDNLSAEESASTLFRFFRSNHVIDLRLITGLVLIASAVHFGIILAFEGTEPLATFSDQLKSFFAPALETYIAILALTYLVADRRREVEDARSVAGFTILAFLVYLFTSLIAGFPRASDLPHGLTTYFAPAVPVYAAMIAWAYLTAATRLGVVDLFACEMRTVCRVGTAFDIATAYIIRRQQCIAKTDAGQGDAPVEERPHRSSSQGFVSQENYFPVFESNSHDLEALEATVVGYITEFYTYMKVVRDLLRKAEDEPAKSAPALYVSIIYVLFLGYESARLAIKELIEFEPTKAENMMMILLTELECYTFLCQYYKDDDLRIERLALRFLSYKEDVEYIRDKIGQHDAGDKDWSPAERTLAPLTVRFDKMKLTVAPLIGKKHGPLSQDNRKTEPTLGGVAA
jgi:hypothetical protein